MSKKEQAEAMERSLPKIFDVENKLTLTSEDVPEIKEWKNDEDYELKSVKVTQLASRVLKNGEIEADFEVKSVKAK